MTTILFPTDLSEAANRAFIYALHIADKLAARIVTLHVYQKPEVRGASHLSHTLEEFYSQYDLYEFANFKDKIPYLDQISKENNFEHIEVCHTLHAGKPKDVILQQAEAEKVDLIVMGTTGARGLKQILLGSVAGEVLENANCPVLAVPEKSEFDGKIDHMGLTFSFKEEEEVALQQLIRLAKLFDADVHCVNIDLAHTEFHNKRMPELREHYAEEEKVHFEVINGTDFKVALSQYLEEHRVDFLAMVTHKRSFLEELFNYSNAKSMSYHSKTPILSFPASIL